MHLKVVADARAIGEAIDEFSSDYYEDFEDVRSKATEYLASTVPDHALVDELSRRLRYTLRVWGAGRRAAALVQPRARLAEALLDGQLHTQLGRLGSLSLANFDIDNGRRVLLGVNEWTVGSFDDALIDALNRLSEDLLIDNTNVTYPMKALLLLTGLLPALDGQVRRGLSHAGLRGLDASALKIPLDADTTAGKKVTRLPYLLGKCWQTYSQVFRDGCTRSSRGQIENSLGRLFDVLLFMQGSQKLHIFELSNTHSPWFALD